VILVMPRVALEGDSPACVMSKYGALIGISRARAVWRFGFMPGSLLALAAGVSTIQPMWVLAFHDGHVIETYFSTWDPQLPGRFQRILKAAL
jgi:hypothetical protein